VFALYDVVAKLCYINSLHWFALCEVCMRNEECCVQRNWTLVWSWWGAFLVRTLLRQQWWLQR